MSDETVAIGAFPCFDNGPTDKCVTKLATVTFETSGERRVLCRNSRNCLVSAPAAGNV